jgi:hypothetical protein
VTAGNVHVAAMLEQVERFKQESTQREQQLIVELPNTVAVIASSEGKLVEWQYKAESGWVAYCTDITAALEKGYKVRTI